MFVGHYAPGLAAKSVDRSIPLWLLFLAVQLVDIAWAILVMLGIEKVRIAPGITATNPLDLYYMPYTHSLVAAVLWSAAALAAYRLFARPGSWTAPALVGGAVLSHWVLDLLVHRPDLPLYGDVHKVGLGLWDYPVPALLLELGLLLGGLYLYVRATRPVSPAGRYALPLFCLFMVGAQILAFFGPPPPSDRAGAATALTSYLAFAGIAAWLERKRA